MRMQIRLAALAAAASVLLITAACRHQIVFETPTAQQAYYADQALQQVGRIQQLVIDEEAAGKLSTLSARRILLGCRVLDVALPAATTGWRTAAQVAAWQTARQALAITDTSGATTYTLPEQPPLDWKTAVQQIWSALKARVPDLTGNPTLSTLSLAVDAALGSL